MLKGESSQLSFQYVSRMPLLLGWGLLERKELEDILDQWKQLLLEMSEE